jgi:hypothetical protein
MFVYALAKSVRLGYIDKSYWDVVKKGYAGILNEFITINDRYNTINLNQICLTAGLGFGRDGTFDYYANQTDIVSNDGKATGPFVLASLEVENAGLVVPPLNFSATLSNDSKVVLTWKDMSYNANSFIVERKKENEANFEEIANLPKGNTSFTDSTIDGVGNYLYRAKAVSDTAASDYSGIDTININPSSVNQGMLNDINFRLYQNYPNPFNPSTIISYQIPSTGIVTIKIYDTLGREVETLVNEVENPGRHEVEFSAKAGTGKDGSNLSSGLYFYRITANNFSETKKMLLMK